MVFKFNIFLRIYGYLKVILTSESTQKSTSLFSKVKDFDLPVQCLQSFLVPSIFFILQNTIDNSSGQITCCCHCIKIFQKF